jgi:Fic family protein
MSVAETSVMAYKEHRSTGKVGSQAMYIFETMGFNKDYSRREIVQITGLELSSVCGRINEMLQSGMLKEVSQRKCKVTGKTIKPIVKLSLF